MSEQELGIIYVAGYGRSGSTLLARLLGQMPGCCPVGELFSIWTRGLAQDLLCGCGEPIKQCRFWNAVVSDAFGGFQCINIAHVGFLQSSTSRPWHFPSVAWPFLATPEYCREVESFRDILSRLYRSIQTISGCRFIVDSSKLASYELILNQLPGVKLYVIHLVRDSRAVAYSQQRIKVRLEVNGNRTYMPRRSPLYTSMAWSLGNEFARLSRSWVSHYTLMRYEDLVSNPRVALLQAVEDLGLSALDLSSIVDEDSVNLLPSHTVWGNPSRFEQGTIKICPDVEWRAKMRRSHKYLVTALTWPLLLRYGYVG